VTGSPDWSQPPFHEEVFPALFGKPFLVWTVVSFLLLFLVAAGMEVAFTGGLGAGPVLASIGLSLAVAVACGAIAAIYTVVLPVRLTRDAISGMNAYGARQTIQLSDIVRVTRPWYGLGIYWIVRSSKSSFKIWLPTFLKEERRFELALRRVVAADHPLLRAIEGGLAD
jgi:hypothetical protein